MTEKEKLSFMRNNKEITDYIPVYDNKLNKVTYKPFREIMFLGDEKVSQVHFKLNGRINDLEDTVEKLTNENKELKSLLNEIRLGLGIR